MKRAIANTLRAISLILLLGCGLFFGSDALDSGGLPLLAFAGFGVAAVLFWIGEKLAPHR